jgi:hypothetical protein
MLDKRKEPRHIINRPAKFRVKEDIPAQNCVIIDISNGGARLRISAQDVPEHFILVLSESGVVCRHCRVAWRSGDELGAEFMKKESWDTARNTAILGITGGRRERGPCLTDR